MNRLIIVLGILLLFHFYSYSQNSNISKVLTDIPNERLSIKNLSKEQKSRIDSLQSIALTEISDSYIEMEELNDTLKKLILQSGNTQKLTDQINDIENKILNTKINHSIALRQILTEKQREKFDLAYSKINKRSTNSTFPLYYMGQPDRSKFANRKNVIKTNLISLGLKNYNLSYERRLSERWTLSYFLTLMPKTQTPFVKSLNDFVMGYDQTHEDIERNRNNPILNLKTGGYRTGIQARFYFPYTIYKSGNAMSGFYLGSIIHSSGYKHTTSFTGSLDGDEFGASLEMKTEHLGFGLQLGNQWVVNDRLILDFTIFGLSTNYTRFNGKISADSQIDLIKYIDEVLDFNLGFWEDSSRDMVSSVEINLESKKSSTGFLVAFAIGYAF